MPFGHKRLQRFDLNSETATNLILTPDVPSMPEGHRQLVKKFTNEKAYTKFKSEFEKVINKIRKNENKLPISFNLNYLEFITLEETNLALPFFFCLAEDLQINLLLNDIKFDPAYISAQQNYNVSLDDKSYVQNKIRQYFPKMLDIFSQTGKNWTID